MKIKKGIVSSSQKFASLAGQEILKEGGSAVDAAISMAAVLAVTEPTSNSFGGDAYAIIHDSKRIYGLNGSGKSPSKISADFLKEKGVTKMPKRGWESTTVPGVVSAWFSMHERFGKMPFRELLEHAKGYAKNGFKIAPITLESWLEDTLQLNYGNDEFNRIFSLVKNDKDNFCQPDLASTIEIIQQQGEKGFYRSIGEAITDYSNKSGGYFSMDDFIDHKSEWVDPICAKFNGHEIWEIPSNTQGIVALEAFEILKYFDLNKLKEFEKYHLYMEALRLSFSDAYANISDHNYMKVTHEKILKNAEKRAKLIKFDRKLNLNSVKPIQGGTVYLCAVDSNDLMVSLIQSTFWGFGSGIVVPGTGVALQNRGFSFSLDETHVNFLEPGKRPFHTIIPGFLTKEKKAVGPFGIMGGDMQPQAHLQVISKILSQRLSPVEALEAKRLKLKATGELTYEFGFDKGILDSLQKLGHPITNAPGIPREFGGGQIIFKRGNEFLAASDSRKDGCYYSV